MLNTTKDYDKEWYYIKTVNMQYNFNFKMVEGVTSLFTKSYTFTRYEILNTNFLLLHTQKFKIRKKATAIVSL